MENKPLHPLITQKVVNIADIRAQRMSALEVTEIHEATEAGDLPQFGPKETVFLRNMQFFQGRLARPEMGDYGRVAFKVGHLADGSRVMLFTCDPFEAVYSLDEQWVIDFTVDPLVTRWSIPQPCEFILVDRRNINFTEITE